MTKKDNVPVSWFVQSYYKPYAATAILSEPISEQTENSMSMCRVRLCGLKPCDINYSTNDKTSEIPLQRSRESSFDSPTTSPHHAEKTTLPETDYLNLHIKPLAKPMNSFFSSHESSPIRIMIRETSRGRHRICVSQSLLRPT